jgi:hypothetical protein
MAQYRKKPVVVEAVQWLGHETHPKVSTMPRKDNEPATGWIHTLEGQMQVTIGDWIITGVKGEHYPCKPDIFEMTYEAV